MEHVMIGRSRKCVFKEGKLGSQQVKLFLRSTKKETVWYLSIFIDRDALVEPNKQWIENELNTWVFWDDDQRQWSESEYRP